MRTFGVLALQGDWCAHGAALDALGATSRPVRTAADLDLVDAMVLPGGESSAMLRLMEPENLMQRIGQRISDGMPVLATCAGVILLAEKVEPPQTCLGVLAVGVVRNAYGRQVHSSIEEIEVAPILGSPATMEAVFIRAPRIVSVGAGAEVLGRWRGDPVLVRQGRVVGATFHPELTGDLRLHKLFLQMGEGRDG